MTIIRERKINYQQPIKTPMEAIKAVELIESCFSNIDSHLLSFHRIFIRSDWYLKEGYSDSLEIYSETIEKVRINLDNLEKVIVSLNNFLLSNKRPIPLSKNAPKEINRFVNAIEKTLKHYYSKAKGKKFPLPDDEVKRCKMSIQKINSLITKINEINSAGGQKSSVGMLKDLNIQKS
jgi:hypothetical protein